MSPMQHDAPDAAAHRWEIVIDGRTEQVMRTIMGQGITSKASRATSAHTVGDTVQDSSVARNLSQGFMTEQELAELPVN